MWPVVVVLGWLLAGCGRLEFASEFSTAGECNVIPMRVRDFDQTHPDFMLGTAMVGVRPDIVKQRLGGDRTPTLVAPFELVTSEESFADWFHDTPTNVGVEMTEISLESTGEPMVRRREGADVFPLDELAPGVPNGLYTAELHAWFIGAPAQEIRVASDDDSWLFIDRRLAIDLGGIHMATMGSVILDDVGLAAGAPHEVDIFYADRAPQQVNLTIETTNISCLRAN